MLLLNANLNGQVRQPIHAGTKLQLLLLLFCALCDYIRQLLVHAVTTLRPPKIYRNPFTTF